MHGHCRSDPGKGSAQQQTSDHVGKIHAWCHWNETGVFELTKQKNGPLNPTQVYDFSFSPQLITFSKFWQSNGGYYAEKNKYFNLILEQINVLT